MVSKKLIVAIIIGVIVVGFAISYSAFYPVLLVAFTSLTMDQELIESEISGYYQKYLNREPDSMGLGHYKQRILEGNSFEWVEDQIKNSEEAKIVKFEQETDAMITQFYKNYLQRVPDLEGLAYYKQLVYDGVTFDEIESKFKNSDEAKIVQLYQKYLNRTPDQEGLNYYLQRINEGESFQTIEELFKNSDERMDIQNKLEIQSKITELYNTYLNRDPDPEGLNYYTHKILEGNSFEWVEDQIKNSEEAEFILNN